MAQVTDPHTVHGEGPVWIPALGGVAWLDMLAGDILILNADTAAVSRRHLGEVVACLRPRSRGGFIAALEDSFALYDTAGNLEAISKVVEAPGVRFNEGTCDLDGNFLCGTMAYDQATGRGDVFRMTPAAEVEKVIAGVSISNGMQFTRSHGGRYIDSPTGTIERLEIDQGRIIRTPFVHIPADFGMPDGLCMDTEGGTWVAMWGGGHVRRYDADGELDLVIEVPADQVTACTFGGPDLATLYITTSRLGLDDRGGPAGALFAADVDFCGYPPLPFAG
ncbi:SMP-30/gluconolactonase/LRE family protein [Microbacterium invictum]|uniref:SMP-30/gluconolactonase/LRE family protein n=1 Tax=Microbacterium invictum TaxID=515415 RepID=A0ABZ0VFV4_9MICO|nr:SMP-30/gluconolactonase/LRE family protein [Microbacterium invictum]WQB70672.1 SMP-30/gluconolactonase/LRE family protein [Microbacterium invictum]